MSAAYAEIFSVSSAFAFISGNRHAIAHEVRPQYSSRRVNGYSVPAIAFCPVSAIIAVSVREDRWLVSAITDPSECRQGDFGVSRRSGNRECRVNNRHFRGLSVTSDKPGFCSGKVGVKRRRDCRIYSVITRSRQRLTW